MLLDQTGAKHSQSPVEAEGGAVMVGTKFLLCPGVDINRISLCKAFVRMSVRGVRRGKAALSSGCKPHPATAPAGSNRSSHGGNEVAEAFD
jgi:hypothetical protein